MTETEVATEIEWVRINANTLPYDGLGFVGGKLRYIGFELGGAVQQFDVVQGYSSYDSVETVSSHCAGLIEEVYRSPLADHLRTINILDEIVAKNISHNPDMAKMSQWFLGYTPSVSREAEYQKAIIKKSYEVAYEIVLRMIQKAERGW